jgi:hypothetical protein
LKRLQKILIHEREGEHPVEHPQGISGSGQKPGEPPRHGPALKRISQQAARDPKPKREVSGQRPRQEPPQPRKGEHGQLILQRRMITRKPGSVTLGAKPTPEG